MEIAERQRSQESRIDLMVGNESVSLAVRVLPTAHGESVFMHLLSVADAKDAQRSTPAPAERTGAAIEPAETESSQRKSQFDAVLLFSESNTRFICEVPAAKAEEFSRRLANVPHAKIGEVRADNRLEVIGTGGAPCLVADVDRLKQVWQKPLDW